MTRLWQAIEQRLAQEGDRSAFESKASGTISYDRLRSLTEGIARGLERNGPVAVLASRSVEAYAAVLACYRFGRTFVPLNPGFPPDRLKKIIDRSGAVECLYDAKYAKLAGQFDLSTQPIDLDAEGDGSAAIPPHDDQIVYQLFTSGSTGEPKGVPITHACLSHYAENLVATVGIEEHQRTSQFFDLSFDLSMHDIFITLMTGGTLIPASDMDLLMPHRFVAANKIDVWFSVPLLAVAAARGQSAMPAEAHLKKTLFCGEALPGGYARSMADLMVEGGEIWNLYGPTEATIAFTAHRLSDSDFDENVVPLGAPFGENRIAVLIDDEIELAEEGKQGELLLGGPQVFSGYQPPIDKDPFVTDPAGEKYYRTGDLVRIVGGNVQYIGRLDSQVKIRGHRVELGEIESACKRVDGVEAAAAIVVGDHANPSIVVAFQGDETAEFGNLSSVLPTYMIPKEYRYFGALPTNSNGKIDRNAIKELL